MRDIFGVTQTQTPNKTHYLVDDCIEVAIGIVDTVSAAVDAEGGDVTAVCVALTVADAAAEVVGGATAETAVAATMLGVTAEVMVEFCFFGGFFFFFLVLRFSAFGWRGAFANFLKTTTSNAVNCFLIASLNRDTPPHVRRVMRSVGERECDRYSFRWSAGNCVSSECKV